MTVIWSPIAEGGRDHAFLTRQEEKALCGRKLKQISIPNLPPGMKCFSCEKRVKKSETPA